MRVRAGDEPVKAASVVATMQRGAIATAQLGVLGLSRDWVTHRRAQGLLHRLHHGVYLLGHGVLPAGCAEVAAILSCGRRGVLGEDSAAWLHGFAPPPAPAVHLLLASGKARSRPPLRIRHTRTLGQDQVQIVCGLPATTPFRTLLDLAARRHPELERRIADAHACGAIDADVLLAEIETRSGAVGLPRLRALAGPERAGLTRSAAERELRALCRRARLPEPKTNLIVAGWEIDLAWPEHRVLVELDLYNTHGGRAQFERDRAKQSDVVAAGHVLLRVSGQQLRGEPLVVITRIAAAIALHGGPTRPT